MTDRTQPIDRGAGRASTRRRRQRRRTAGRAALLVAVAAAIVGCTMSDPDITYEESRAEALALTEEVAATVGDADRLERITVGPLSCGGDNRYAGVTGYLPLDVAPTDDVLDTIAEAIAARGYVEAERREFASGPYRLWETDEDLTISATAITAENALEFAVRGPCAQPPVSLPNE